MVPASWRFIRRQIQAGGLPDVSKVDREIPWSFSASPLQSVQRGVPAGEIRYASIRPSGAFHATSIGYEALRRLDASTSMKVGSAGAEIAVMRKSATMFTLLEAFSNQDMPRCALQRGRLRLVGIRA